MATRGPNPRAHPRAQNAPELKVAGRNACRALFHARPDDIRRVYVTDATLKIFGDVLKWCAQQRIAYHIKTDADLDAIAETVHHDGVVFIAREKPVARVDDAIARIGARRGPACVVLLEDVKNPHNLGAILRVCAHFGVSAVLAARDTPALSPAAMRTAEGGAEHVDVVPAGDGVDALKKLRSAGFKVLATSSHTNATLGAVALPERSVVMFGSEGEGLSRALLAQADVTLAIPGSGALESLNVACAASVVLWELWRASPAQPASTSTRASAQHAHGEAGTRRSEAGTRSQSARTAPSEAGTPPKRPHDSRSSRNSRRHRR